MSLTHPARATCPRCGARVSVSPERLVERHYRYRNGAPFVVEVQGQGGADAGEGGRALVTGFLWCDGEGQEPLGTPITGEVCPVEVGP